MFEHRNAYADSTDRIASVFIRFKVPNRDTIYSVEQNKNRVQNCRNYMTEQQKQQKLLQDHHREHFYRKIYNLYLE